MVCWSGVTRSTHICWVPNLFQQCSESGFDFFCACDHIPPASWCFLSVLAPSVWLLSSAYRWCCRGKGKKAKGRNGHNMLLSESKPNAPEVCRVMEVQFCGDVVGNDPWEHGPLGEIVEGAACAGREGEGLGRFAGRPPLVVNHTGVLTCSGTAVTRNEQRPPPLETVGFEPTTIPQL